MIKTIAFTGNDFSKLIYSNFIASIDSLVSGSAWVKNDEGVCSDGSNHIYSIELGDSSKPTILIDGGMHGYNEWRCCYWVRDFASELVSPTNKAHSMAMAKLRSKFHFIIIPCLNPHGYINNVRWNFNEVDINRNFDSDWAAYGPEDGWGGKGSSAFSEVESTLIKNLIDMHKPVMYINTHTWGSSAGGTNSFGATTNLKQLLLGKDIVDSIKLAWNTYMVYWGQPDSVPKAAYWASKQTSVMGNCFGAICESGYPMTHTEQSELGLTSLFNYCISIYKYIEKRQLVNSEF